MHKRGAFSLSIEFVVILVIAIIIFTFGLWLAGKAFSRAEEIKLIYDERTQQEIERLIYGEGNRVTIPFNTKNIELNDFETFSIGILNVVGYATDFNVMVNYDSCDPLGCDSPPSSSDINFYWLKGGSGAIIEYDSLKIRDQLIDNNELKIYTIGIEPKNAERKSTYIFNVNVEYRPCDESGICSPTYQSYDNTHKIYVTIP